MTRTILAEETTTALTLDGASNPAKNLARMNCGATIDLLGTDGRVVAVTKKDSGPNALLLDDDTMRSCFGVRARAAAQERDWKASTATLRGYYEEALDLHS